MTNSVNQTLKIAILGVGGMGGAIAAELVRNGFEVFTCLQGRGQRSREQAKAAGVQEVGSLEQLVEETDLLLSIIPPGVAEKVALELFAIVQRLNSDLVYIDCNAISPSTATKIAAHAEQYQVNFQDASIIGLPPKSGTPAVRLYTSGPWNGILKPLNSDLLKVIPLGDEIAKASGIKMVYASLSKGTNALMAAALIAGEKLGVGQEIRQEWQNSVPHAYQTMLKWMPILASDSARWIAEMQEISTTYEQLGLPGEFHSAAASIYTSLSTIPMASESRAEALSNNRSLEDVIALYSLPFDTTDQ